MTQMTHAETLQFLESEIHDELYGEILEFLESRKPIPRGTTLLGIWTDENHLKAWTNVDTYNPSLQRPSKRMYVATSSCPLTIDGDMVAICIGNADDLANLKLFRYKLINRMP